MDGVLRVGHQRTIPSKNDVMGFGCVCMHTANDLTLVLDQITS